MLVETGQETLNLRGQRPVAETNKDRAGAAGEKVAKQIAESAGDGAIFQQPR